MKLPKRLIGKHSASHARAPKQEKTVATRLGGRTVRGSGSGNEKGDVRVSGVVRVECKTTTAGSFRVTTEMLDKLRKAIHGTGEVPCMVVEFLQPDGTVSGSVAVLPMWCLETLIANQANE